MSLTPGPAARRTGSLGDLSSQPYSDVVPKRGLYFLSATRLEQAGRRRIAPSLGEASVCA